MGLGLGLGLGLELGLGLANNTLTWLSTSDSWSCSSSPVHAALG